jgi:hypothetical protein
MMKNNKDLDETLDTAMISSINRMITSKFRIPLEKYGVEVEDFISQLYVIAYKRGTYDKTKAKVSTYFYWLARTEMSHIKDSKKIKVIYGTPILDENGLEQIHIEDGATWIHPEKCINIHEEAITARKILAEYFFCEVSDIIDLLDTEPKYVIQTAKAIAIKRGFDEEETETFLSKVKMAKSSGGWSK